MRGDLQTGGHRVFGQAYRAHSVLEPGGWALVLRDCVECDGRPVP